MLSTRTRLLAIVGGTLASLLLITAAGHAAGPPTSLSVLLCGTTSGFSADRVSGNSSIDHPSGLNASGKDYTYSGQNCRTNGSSSNGSFTWTIRQDNVNLATERGNEHADASSTTLAQTGSFANGFDGGVYEFDLPNGDFTTCQDGSQVYYASGRPFDTACSVGTAPGNFNTEGGASSGQHFNGKYGTLIYRFGSSSSGSPCGTDQSATYCFEAIIQGKVN